MAIVRLGGAFVLVRWLGTRAVFGSVMGLVLVLAVFDPAGLRAAPLLVNAAFAAVWAACLVFGDWLVLRRYAVHWAYVPAFLVVVLAATGAMSLTAYAYSVWPAARAIDAAWGSAAPWSGFWFVSGLMVGLAQGVWQWAFLRKRLSPPGAVRPWLLVPAHVLWVALVYLAPWQLSTVGEEPPLPPYDAAELGVVGMSTLDVAVTWMAWGVPTGLYLALARKPSGSLVVTSD
jgi:hypothetical protein